MTELQSLAESGGRHTHLLIVDYYPIRGGKPGIKQEVQFAYFGDLKASTTLLKQVAREWFEAKYGPGQDQIVGARIVALQPR